MVNSRSNLINRKSFQVVCDDLSEGTQKLSLSKLIGRCNRAASVPLLCFPVTCAQSYEDLYKFTRASQNWSRRMELNHRPPVPMTGAPSPCCSSLFFCQNWQEGRDSNSRPSAQRGCTFTVLPSYKYGALET